MSRDVNAVVSALFTAGVKTITIKDFHRTGYNLFPELIDSRAALVSGYRRGPVPGIGHPYKAEAVMFLGMHAASGSDGFLSHTLTSRISRLEVNHKLLAEIELFAASLAPWEIRPIFFSGCPVACQQANAAIDNIHCHGIDKTQGAENFDVQTWRSKLAQSAVRSLENYKTVPHAPIGPLDAIVTWREGQAAAARLAYRWKLKQRDNRIHIHAGDMHELYLQLIKICYLTPAVTKILPLAMMGFDVWGRSGIWRARRRLMRWGAFS